jgi:hypothetical protein
MKLNAQMRNIIKLLNCHLLNHIFILIVSLAFTVLM